MSDEQYLEDYDDEGGEVEFYAIRPNKTRIKKEIAEIFAMAEEICQMSHAHIAEFGLPESVEESLQEAGRMPANAARKRLLKYVTQQFRELDTAAIQEKLSKMKNRSAHGTREHHQTERWRERLLSEQANTALTELIAAYPSADSQHIRQLQRNALKEAKESKPPKSSRLLYQYLKQLISGDSE